MDRRIKTPRDVNTNSSADRTPSYSPSVRNQQSVVEFYIGNIDQSVTVDMIADHIHCYDIFITNLRLFQSKRPGILAAKLSVPIDHAYSLQQPHFWPDGVYSRPWHM